jgi:AcrR family transcriptional regulator
MVFLVVTQAAWQSFAGDLLTFEVFRVALTRANRQLRDWARRAHRVHLRCVCCSVTAISTGIMHGVAEKSKRAARGGLRQDHVALTEQRILEAATSLFVDRGYVGTSLLAVAEAAGVAPRTVYVRFGSKAQLLVRCIETSIVGDQQPAPLLDRASVRPGLRGATLEIRIDALASTAGAIMRRSAALFAVGSQAAAVEPEMAAMERVGMQQTLHDFRLVAERMAADGMLPAGMTAEEVTDLLWVVAGPRTMVSLRNDRGWSADQFTTWVGSALRAALTTC